MLTLEQAAMRHHRIAIIGAGLSGLEAAYRLRRRGIGDFVILERADDVGGVWRDNVYPGVGVDTPSALYSLSHDLNPNWSHHYAKGGEVYSYARQLAETHGLLTHVRFGHAVLSARWDGERALWQLETSAGNHTAQFVITAAGLNADPSTPEIPGLSEFPGAVFHSARWDHSLNLRDKRVAVIGTGASAIQFVPEIAPLVSELHVVQRTASWVAPKLDKKLPAKKRTGLSHRRWMLMLRYAFWYWVTELAATMRISRGVRSLLHGLCNKHLRAQVADPQLRAALTPTFEFGCKRPLTSSDWYPALCRDNATLHTGGLAELRGSTVVAGDGSTADVDVVILSTGFEIGIASPIARVLHDAQGRSLADHWGDNPHAYKGITHPEFPNLFIMQGPNATSGVSSSLVFAEAQAIYIADALSVLACHDIAVVTVSAEAEREWTSMIRSKSKHLVYENGGCRSYYQNTKGENVVMWPTWCFFYQFHTRKFDAGAYALTPAAEFVAKELSA
jgi:cation diffusion facilitator CzcD-associated flavoprotein CzcO